MFLTCTRKKIPRTFQIWEGQKCTACHNTGYKGRIGVFEAVLMDEAIEKVTIANPSEREIKKAAEPQNILTMQEDGVFKVLQGTTTLEEIERAVGLEGN